jgi:C1A family cysteine protease
LIDCSGSYGNQGCNGGWPSSALQYIRDKGLSLESQYPYKAVTQTCKINNGTFKINSFVTVSNSCSALTTSIAVQPIAVTVDATNWSSYSSGVFNNCSASINHAVLLVGVVSTNWKIKNSWGASWG